MVVFDFFDFKILFLVFIIIFIMFLIYSISIGLVLGFLLYLIVYILVGDFKKINIILFFIGVICLFYLFV